MGKAVSRWLAAPLGSLFFLAGAARASSFTVNPIKIVLGEKERSTLLSVQNQSTEALRFQISVSGWNQSPTGEMVLSATKDIVVYPSILTLGPGEQRKLRVGASVPSGATEKSYRIFVEELPPLQSAKKDGKSEVRVLTKMGVPVFVEPQRPATRATIEGLALAGGKLAVEVKNGGNVHFMAGKIAVRALGAGGARVLDKELQGWYVLAGGSRRFEVDIPKDACGKIKSFTVEMPMESGSPVSAKLDAPAGGCAP